MESNWRDKVVAYIRNEANPKDKYGHQPRLYALATTLGQGTDYDDDVLFAAAWMHDLGVFIGHRPEDTAELANWNHVPYTIEKTRELLNDWGFPAQSLDAVAEAVRTHQPQDHPELYEAVLLRDADILEQLGAVGALRAFVKVGRDTRYPTFSSVIPGLRRAVDELPGKLSTEAGRSMARPKIEILTAFLEALEKEAGALLL